MGASHSHPNATADEKPSSSPETALAGTKPQRVSYPGETSQNLSIITKDVVCGQANSSSSLRPYCYEPLKPNRQFRLLSVRSNPTPSGPEWEYNLVTFPLDHAPSYETVSYVWGDNKRLHSLNLAEDTLLVTESISKALPLLSPHCTTGYLWIDQLCINQDDITERNNQVRLMGELYSRSVRTLVYLQVKQWAIDCIVSFLEAEPDFQKAGMNDQFNNKALERQLELDYSSDSSNAHTWRSIVELMNNPWFTRAWIAQEVILSQVVDVIVGKIVVSFETLHHLALTTARMEQHTLKTHKPEKCVISSTGFNRLHPVAKVRIAREKGKQPKKFWDLLSNIAQYSHSSDPHDAIYAFLGLLDDDRVSIDVDYSVSESQVYMRTASAAIIGHRNLDILGLANPAITESKSLPSWVPYWKEMEPIVPLYSISRDSAFSASLCRPHTPSSSIKIGSDVPWGLPVRGKVICHVTTISHPFIDDLYWSKRKMTEFLRLEDLAEKSLFLLKYPTTDILYSDAYEMTMERLLRVVLADLALWAESEYYTGKPISTKERLDSMMRAYLSESDPRTKTDSVYQAFGAISTLRDLARIAGWRRVVVTNTGFLGLAHHSVRKGDLICILHGSNVPIVLRMTTKAGNFLTRDVNYKMIGQAYIEGMMDGEVVDWKEEDAEEFLLV